MGLMYIISNFVEPRTRKANAIFNSKFLGGFDAFVRHARNIKKSLEAGEPIPPLDRAGAYPSLVNNLDKHLEYADAWRGVLAPTYGSFQPKNLKLKLYDYQAKGLSWMLGLERKIQNKQNFAFSSLLTVPG